MSYPPFGCAFGFEYQIVDDTSLSGQSHKNSTGAYYNLVAPDKGKVLSPVGEYNTSRIIVNENHCEHWLNGGKTLAYDMGTDCFDSQLNKRKFTGFAEKRSGHIV